MKDLLKQKELYLWFLKSKPASTLKKQISKLKKQNNKQNNKPNNPTQTTTNQPVKHYAKNPTKPKKQ